MIKNSLKLTLIFFITNIVFSQPKLGSWNIINVNLKINKKWNVFAETQLRSL